MRVQNSRKLEKKHLINLRPGQAKGSLPTAKGIHFWYINKYYMYVHSRLRSTQLYINRINQTHYQ
jgi:hypothetical protein